MNIKKFSSLLVFSSIFAINSSAYTIDVLKNGIDNNETIEMYKMYHLANSTNTKNEDVMVNLKRTHTFAKAYLDKLSSDEKFELDMFLNSYLSKKFVEKELKNVTFDEEEKVLKSYYEMHKSQKYRHPAIVDFFMIKFDTKDEANEYKKLLKSKKDISKFEKNERKEYLSLHQSALTTTYSFYLDNLKENELSEPLDGGNGYYLIYYKNKKDAGIIPFELVKEEIKKYLVNIKKDEYLNSVYLKLENGSK